MKTIEAAKDRDGAEQAANFIAKLERSRRRKDRDRIADIAVRFNDFAVNGRLRAPREINDLEDGIKEIKAGDVRLPFYEEQAGGHRGLVRLTHGFSKKQQKCPLKEIRKAIAIRREDQQQ
ncbi:type II toxin-antitoxin system RelE/ParE family toxin [Actinomadura bangladeshensis]|uniref:Type II toxin-antitoxin system RelE/ParE family toxin n=1 Tax=Actinomadura bangladeshensis TaxID=453573 RepID=A0A4R4NG91_9ACTN|nr:type II toxin-antitoxin system RelE/ParE family toxin [Actinomadura bangladeshensis]TDC05822.1 hypothetical protein E1284_34805 [Actinomadura bangladeshensis]